MTQTSPQDRDALGAPRRPRRRACCVLVASATAWAVGGASPPQAQPGPDTQTPKASVETTEAVSRHSLGADAIDKIRADYTDATHVDTLTYQEHCALSRAAIPLAFDADSVYVAIIDSTCARFFAKRPGAVPHVVDRIEAALGARVHYDYDPATLVLHIHHVPAARLIDATHRIDVSDGEYPDCFLSLAELNAGLHPDYPPHPDLPIPRK